MNLKTAPKLYHEGKKVDGWFYWLPQKQMDVLFEMLDGKKGNMIKLMIILMGTFGDGSFGISEKWICNRTGMTKQNYHRSMKELAKMGLVSLQEKKIILNLNALVCDDNIDEDEKRMLQDVKSSCDDNQNGIHDEDYNIKKQHNKYK